MEGTPSDAAPTSPRAGSVLWRLRLLVAPVEGKEQDRPLRFKGRGTLILAGCALPLVSRLLAAFPNAVEALYTERIGQGINRALTRISGLVPFSVVEALFLLLGLWFVASCSLAVYRVGLGKRHIGNAIACGVLRVGAVGAVLSVIFYVGWGFNYARADLITRMRWEAYAKGVSSEADLDDLGRLCEELISAGNRDYERATGCQDLGHPSAPPMPTAALDATLDKAYELVTRRLGLPASFGLSRGRAKPVALSAILSRLLILGFYSPWTGEANFNREMPACRLPEVLAHEKAHQRGVASEDEASFFGFLACISSDEPYARYSGYLMGQRQLLPELGKRDLQRLKSLLRKRDPGVQRDADAINQFREAHLGVASKVGLVVNNVYLKANRVKEGVKAYQRSAQLILVFARVNGGTCLVNPEPDTYSSHQRNGNEASVAAPQHSNTTRIALTR